VKIYVVGGAIRDQLLGLVAKDRDYVVVGSTPEEMITQGFTPVGQDFPVFLHPKTKEEYALARTERKSGQGYKGFTFYTSPEVTLEQDLIRRDFTVNAMAQEVSDNGALIGPIIDPYGGQKDLKKRLFRHVSEAFKEDPLRVLRLGRFLARFNQFLVEPTTQVLVKEMVASRELEYLVPERIWQELSRGLMESRPSRMLDFLNSIGVNQDFLPAHLLIEVTLKNTGQTLDQLASQHAPLENRLAVLLCELDLPGLELWLEKNKVPTDLRSFVKGYRQVISFLKASHSTSQEYLSLFDVCDLWRKPERFLQICALAKSLGMNTLELDATRQKVQAVNAGEIAQKISSQNGREIAEAVRMARLRAISSDL
jgi:tRNA nucleotidyltransferase (CCA-adding enzyme)